MRIHLSADEVRAYIRVGIEDSLGLETTDIEIHNRGAATVTVAEAEGLDEPGFFDSSPVVDSNDADEAD